MRDCVVIAVGPTRLIKVQLQQGSTCECSTRIGYPASLGIIATAFIVVAVVVVLDQGTFAANAEVAVAQ
jgi:hypothetical protein